MTNNNSEFLTFSGSEFIADVLQVMPEASDILIAHGLGCIECHFSAFETLAEGFLTHGFSQEELDGVLTDLNEAAHDLELSPNALSHIQNTHE